MDGFDSMEVPALLPVGQAGGSQFRRVVSREETPERERERPSGDSVSLSDAARLDLASRELSSRVLVAIAAVAPPGDGRELSHHLEQVEAWDDVTADGIALLLAAAIRGLMKSEERSRSAAVGEAMIRGLERTREDLDGMGLLNRLVDAHMVRVVERAAEVLSEAE